MCVCSLSYPACKAHAPNCILIYGLAYCAYFSTLSHKRHDYRKKKVIEHKICILILQLLCYRFLILRRSHRYILFNVHRSRCKVPVIFFRILTRIFWTYFREILRHKISWKSDRWEPSCSIRTDRYTDMTKLIVASRNFAHALENGT